MYPESVFKNKDLREVPGNEENVFDEKNVISSEVNPVGSQAKKEYLFLLWKQYKSANRKIKSEILDELERNFKIHRKSATRLMCSSYPPKSLQGKKGGAKKRYSQESKSHLERLWKSMGYMGAERMKPALREWLEFYEAPGFNSSIKEELLRISISSIKRFLAKARAQLKRKMNTGTKRGIRKFIAQVPIRNLEETPRLPGHCEIDCVAHCGGSLSGEFAWTLNLTDIATGWTECEAIWGKSGYAVRKALELMEKRLPFKLQSIYFDNGTEFMNSEVIEKFAVQGRKDKIEVYRGRPYKKNDQCYIEQKNYTHVRQLFGYGRMDWKPGINMMNSIYRKEWRKLQNYYMPQQKLESKERHGSKIVRKMGSAETPISRLEAAFTSDEMRAIIRDKKTTNPFQLRHNQRVKVRKLNSHIKYDMPTSTWGKMAI
ncbi:MAG: hypothetical protein R3B45_16990 [Bdellovibrionota bacterium]